MHEKRHAVCLTDTERKHLKQMIAAGQAPACKLMHVRILLKAEQSTQGPGETDEETDEAIAHAVEVSQPTVFRDPEAERMVLVLVNLNTHTPDALYDAFPPAEANRLTDKLELRYTPQAWQLAQHGGRGVERAERPMPGPALPDRDTLALEVAAWETARNAERAIVDWRFTTADAISRSPISIHHFSCDKALEQLARSKGRQRLCKIEGYACVFDRSERALGASGG